MKKNLDIAKPRYHGYSDQILPVSWSSLFGDSTLNENNGKTVFKFLNTVMPKTLQGYLKRALYINCTRTIILLISLFLFLYLLAAVGKNSSMISTLE